MHTLNGTLELVAPDRLIPHPQHFHKGNVAAIAESIAENGFYGVVIAQRSTAHVLAGLARLRAIERLGGSHVPVLWVDVGDTAALRILAAEEGTTAGAERDDAVLAALLQELDAQGALPGTGFDAHDVERLLASLAADLPESFKLIDVEAALAAADPADPAASALPGAPGAPPAPHAHPPPTTHVCPACGHTWTS